MSDDTPVARLHSVRDAKRCIRAIKAFLVRHESPLAAEDLETAIKILESAAAENPYANWK